MTTTTTQVSNVTKSATPGQGRRIVALDGFRGFMTIVVVVSHFFAEVPGGIEALMVGWLGVDAFFVLSGYLIGRLILDKGHYNNFFKVFYIRRICRTFPIYFVCVIGIFYIERHFQPPTLHAAGQQFELWTYLTFVQNFFMGLSSSIGMHWLAPTWTLAVEEQFYLIAPAAMIFVPRRFMVPMLIGTMVVAAVVRFYILSTGALPSLSAHILFLPNADVLVAGMLGAVLIRNKNIDWNRLDFSLRLGPIILLAVSMGIVAIYGSENVFSLTVVQTIVAVAFAMMILSLVRGAPEAKRYCSPILCFFGNISYAIYLTHLTVLGLLHVWFFDAPAGIETWSQTVVTIAALPLTVVISWVLTKVVEEPITAIGRGYAWSKETVNRGNLGKISVKS